jgi:hypothetical protein
MFNIFGKKESQASRILSELIKHPEGIHSFVINRKMWILRGSERIRELKKLGFNIKSVHEKMGKAWGVRYILES